MAERIPQSEWAGVPRLPERFWSKVDRSGDGCHEWQRYRVPKGYGEFTVKDGDPRVAHMVAWVLTFGPIPSGLCVCHHCDNPPCCRVVAIPESERVPDHPLGIWTNRDHRAGHLFLGTKAENNADCRAKGRTHKGYILTMDDATAIRRRRADGERSVDLAVEYGVSTWQVYNILSGRVWR